jgi:hypothetical protein
MDQDGKKKKSNELVHCVGYFRSINLIVSIILIFVFNKSFNYIDHVWSNSGVIL